MFEIEHTPISQGQMTAVIFGAEETIIGAIGFQFSVGIQVAANQQDAQF